MSALQPQLPGALVLDLYAGSGALGLEALSRGAAHATFVERAGGALRALRANLAKLGAQDEATVIRANALSYVDSLETLAFDLVLADPPYGTGDATALARKLAQHPFGRWLWIEHGRTEVIPELPGSRTRRYGDTALTSIPAEE